MYAARPARYIKYEASSELAKHAVGISLMELEVSRKAD